MTTILGHYNSHDQFETKAGSLGHIKAVYYHDILIPLASFRDCQIFHENPVMSQQWTNHAWYGSLSPTPCLKSATDVDPRHNGPVCCSWSKFVRLSPCCYVEKHHVSTLLIEYLIFGAVAFSKNIIAMATCSFWEQHNGYMFILRQNHGFSVPTRIQEFNIGIVMSIFQMCYFYRRSRKWMPLGRSRKWKSNSNFWQIRCTPEVI